MLIPLTLGLISGALLASTYLWTVLIGFMGLAVLFSCFLPHRPLKVALLAMALAIPYAEWRFQCKKPPLLWREHDNQLIQLTGQLKGIAHYQETGVRRLWQVEGHLIQLTLPYPIPNVQAGDTIQAQVRLKTPKSTINPGRDTRRLSLMQGIAITATVEGNVKLLKHEHTLDYYREQLHQYFYTKASTLPHLGLLEALVLGIKSGVGDKTIFQKTGTSHLMAISGMHIGLVTLWIALIFQKIMGLFPAFLHRFSSIHFGLMGALPVAVVYALLAGFGLPTQRALIMLLCVVGAKQCRRVLPPSTPLMGAMLLIVLWDPSAVQSLGFWLSCLAVACLLYVSRSRLPTQWGIFVGLTPLTVSYFHWMSGIALFSNLVAIPWVCGVVVPLALLALLSSSTLLLGLANHSAELFIQFLTLMAAVSAPIGGYFFPPLWSCVLAGLGALWLLCPSGFWGRGWGVVLFLPLLFPPRAVLPKEGFQVLVWDVGQGLLVSVQTQNHHLLYDVGPRYHGHSVAEEALIPYLKAQGVLQLDTLVISHFDEDHSGALAPILEAFFIQQRYSSDTQTDFGGQACQAGVHWTWDGVHFEFLHPPKNAHFASNNNFSCVLKVSTTEHSLLLTGDIEQEAEAALLHKSNPSSQSEVLIIPHHGSLTSSSPEFIEAVSPKLGIVTTGRYNPYHHPHYEVLARYQARGISFLNTGQIGAVEITFLPQEAFQTRLFNQGKMENLWYN
jgi:competence protein ComEC